MVDSKIPLSVNAEASQRLVVVLGAGMYALQPQASLRALKCVYRVDVFDLLGEGSAIAKKHFRHYGF